jgi:hypothetical protein
LGPPLPKYETISDLPGEITMHTRSTPARTIRSSRYSLTARGLSTLALIWLPTGSNSFEKAKG